MKKVQLFSENDIQSLQEKINMWLSDNKNIDILTTGYSPYSIADAEKHNFYVLYTAINEEAKEITALMEENNPEVEIVAQINNDILKPSN